MQLCRALVLTCLQGCTLAFGLEAEAISQGTEYHPAHCAEVVKGVRSPDPVSAISPPIRSSSPGVSQITPSNGGGGNVRHASQRSPAVASGTGTSSLAAGTCAPEWVPTFGGTGGTSSQINALVQFDDGTGDALYAAGTFAIAGGVPVNGIARHRNGLWSDLAGGVQGSMPQVGATWVDDLLPYDDGSGPALYVAGSYVYAGSVTANCIARWNGTSWSDLAGGITSSLEGQMTAIKVFDDGTGPALYAGGLFDVVGGVGPANNIARWNGTSWSPVSTGLPNLWVRALEVFDDGSGPALFAAGSRLTGFAGLPAERIAKWNGSSWSSVGGGLSASGVSLEVFDDGFGPGLFVAGTQGIIPGTGGNVARWNGTSWSAFATGPHSGTAREMFTHDDGTGERLFVGGNFALPSSGSTCLTTWNGTAWASMAGPTGSVHALAECDSGSGLELHAGGALASMGSVEVQNIARWNGTEWSAIPGYWNSQVHALAEHDDGSGSKLFIGGLFTTVDGLPSRFVAAWNGTSWTTFPSGMPGQVVALGSSVSGGTSELFASCQVFSGSSYAGHVLRWDGVQWNTIGTTDSGTYVTAFQVFDDGSGPALYASGTFNVVGGVAARYVARWNGTAWSTVGGLGPPAPISAMTVFDDGSGPVLHAGGAAHTMVSACTVWRYRNAGWTDIGGPFLQGNIKSLLVHDDGTGPSLFVGGFFFTFVAGQYLDDLVKWNGSTWESVGYVDGHSVSSMVSHDDGGGPALFVAGDFTTVGGTTSGGPLTVSGIARWRSGVWSAMGSGLFGYPTDLCSYDDGAVRALFVAGPFDTAFDSGDSYLAKWGCPPPTITSFCHGDGSSLACPCTNDGAPGHGCANSGFAAGALLAGAGATSVAADTVALTASSMTGATCVFFQGTAEMPPVVIGDGLGCVTGSVIRLGTKSVASNASSFPQPGDPSISVRGALPPAGGTRHYQCFYRNASATFCPPATSNRTNGIVIVWGA